MYPMSRQKAFLSMMLILGVISVINWFVITKNMGKSKLILPQLKITANKLTRINRVPVDGNDTVKIQQIISNDKIANVSNKIVERGWVSVRKMGRIGNNMFQFAAVLAVSKRNNMTPVFPKEILDGIFNIDRSGIILDREMKNSLPTISVSEMRYRNYDKKIWNNFTENTNIIICCYMQSWKYHVEIQEELKRHFRFKSSIDNIATKFIDSVYRDIGTRPKNKQPALVGIHVRRTDMATKQKRKPQFGFVVAPKQYFENAIKHFRSKYKQVHFVVCSDDIKWAQDNIRSTNMTFYTASESPGVDLAILSHCDHIIMSVGTFSWWAAWLSGGEVVYYAGYPRPKSKIGRNFVASDYYFPHWKPMF
ncbi:unnamed protein product [Owenia fusiformis]|uniref:L-Fucosyltransferase n=1 Tax=Owenia fusiformis TaxID=6347 RepID=A0A8J1UVR8_OWEFU|nr:unnamed protein product [Owenia fusiformis]